MSYNYIIDWSKSSIKNIEFIFNKYLISPKRTMEIGVFEGRTTLWMLDSYKSIEHHIAIDPFRGNYEVSDDVLDLVRDRFVDNLDQCAHKSKVEFHECRSVDVLNKIDGPLDFIYIDGDHTSSSVLEDLVRSFQIIRPGGVILLDDATRWKYTHHSSNTKSGDPSLSPRMAIDAFIHCNWARLEVLDIPATDQVAIMKI